MLIALWGVVFAFEAVGTARRGLGAALLAVEVEVTPFPRTSLRIFEMRREMQLAGTPSPNTRLVRNRERIQRIVPNALATFS